MSRIKRLIFFRIISPILITTFLAFDISWAYSPSPNVQNSTLATWTKVRDDPDFPNSIANHGNLLAAVSTIALHLFGDPAQNITPIQLSELSQVFTNIVGTEACRSIDIAEVTFDNGVIKIPYHDLHGQLHHAFVAIADSPQAQSLSGSGCTLLGRFVVKETDIGEGSAPEAAKFISGYRDIDNLRNRLRCSELKDIALKEEIGRASAALSALGSFFSVKGLDSSGYLGYWELKGGKPYNGYEEAAEAIAEVAKSRPDLSKQCMIELETALTTRGLDVSAYSAIAIVIENITRSRFDLIQPSTPSSLRAVLDTEELNRHNKGRHAQSLADQAIRAIYEARVLPASATAEDIAGEKVSVTQIRDRVLHNIDIQISNAPLSGRDFLIQLREIFRSLFGDIIRKVDQGIIRPDVFLRVSKDSPGDPNSQKIDSSRELRVGVLATAGNPLHWGHIFMCLEAINQQNLDVVLLLPQGDIRYKEVASRDDVPKELRHIMAQEALKPLYPLIRYTDVGFDNDRISEENVYAILGLNPDQKINLYCLEGAESVEGSRRILDNYYKYAYRYGLNLNPNHRLSALFHFRTAFRKKTKLTPDQFFGEINSNLTQSRPPDGSAPATIGLQFYTLPIITGGGTSSTRYRNGDRWLAPTIIDEYAKEHALYGYSKLDMGSGNPEDAQRPGLINGDSDTVDDILAAIINRSNIDNNVLLARLSNNRNSEQALIESLKQLTETTDDPMIKARAHLMLGSLKAKLAGGEAGPTIENEYVEMALSTISAALKRSLAPPAGPLKIPDNFNDKKLTISSPVRVDLGDGGASDLFPITYERGGRVINIAVNVEAESPISVTVRRINEPVLRIRSDDLNEECVIDSKEALLQYHDISDKLRLHKAAFSISGIVQASDHRSLEEILKAMGGGIEIATRANLPKGSGLGVSSILGYSVLDALYRISGQSKTSADIANATLCLEQVLGMGGGWQDALGGIFGGIKDITSPPGQPDPNITAIQPSEEFIHTLQDRMVLFYTGEGHYAGDILKKLTIDYLTRSGTEFAARLRLVELDSKFRQAIEDEDVDTLGLCIRALWEDWKILCPQVTNAHIESIFNSVNDLIAGGKLCGAGGGGFAVFIAKDGKKAELEERLRLISQRRPTKIYPCSIDRKGVTATYEPLIGHLPVSREQATKVSAERAPLQLISPEETVAECMPPPIDRQRDILPGKVKRVMLIQPGFQWQVNKPTRMPLGLMYLASALRKDYPGLEVSIVDMPAEGIDSDGLLRLIEKERPDVVGISSVSVFFNVSRDLAKAIKSKWPETLLVMGGAHPSALPDNVLETSDFDVVIPGEGEAAFSRLVKAFGTDKKFEHVSGAWFKKDGKVYHGDLTVIPFDINSLPLAAESLDLLRLDRYDDKLEGELVYPIMAVRGCPYHCAFCGGYAVFPRLRRRSAESVVDEMEYVYRNYGIGFFHFVDDTFTADLKYASRICELILERKLPVKWMAMTRANTIARSPQSENNYKRERDFLALAKRSGCKGFAIGAESGDEKILELLDKKLNLKLLAKATELIKEAGIHVKYFLMAGIPGQDAASIQKTIDVVLQNKPDSVNVTVIKPLPGSELFELWVEMRREEARLGRVLSQDEALVLWQALKVKRASQPGAESTDLSGITEIDDFWEMLMFEEEPGLKGVFAKDKLYPVFQTREVPLDRTLEFRRSIYDAHKGIAKDIRPVPVYRRPFSDAKTRRILDNMSSLLKSEQFEMGPFTNVFEDRFAEYIGARYGIAVSNGTIGLELALRAKFGSLEGKTIVVPANANIADVTCVIQAGGRVLLADVSPETLSIDPDKLISLLDNEGKDLNVAGMIVVHMGGFISRDIERLQAIARQRNLFLVEDASHAHGATYKGKKAGNFGDAAVFSLFSTKVLTSFNGGIILTNDPKLYGKLHSYRQLGRVPEARSELFDTLGNNFRMDEMQSIVASADMDDLDKRLAQRRAIAKTYDAYFDNTEGLRIVRVEGCNSSYYKYLLVVDPAVYPDFNYNQLKVECGSEGVDLPGLIYGYSLDEQIYPEGRLFLPKHGIPVTNQLKQYQIALPIYEELSDAQARRVADVVNKYFSRLYSASYLRRGDRSEGTLPPARPSVANIPVREGYYEKKTREMLLDQLKRNREEFDGKHFAVSAGESVETSAALPVIFTHSLDSDKPSVSIARGGSALGMSVKLEGRQPITCKVSVINKPVIKISRIYIDPKGKKTAHYRNISTMEELRDYCVHRDPLSVGARLLAASGVINTDDSRKLSDIMSEHGGGLAIEITDTTEYGETNDNIFVLLGLVAIQRILGHSDDFNELNETVLLAESFINSPNGWREFSTVYYPGVNELVAPEGSIIPHSNSMPLSQNAAGELRERLVLYDSGIGQVAQESGSSMVDIMPFSYVPTLRNRASFLHGQMMDAVAGGNLSQFGKLLTEGYNLDRLIHKGAGNPIANMIAEVSPLIDGAAYARHFGGRYWLFVAKEGSHEALVEKLEKKGKVMKWSLNKKGIDVKMVHVTPPSETAKDLSAAELKRVWDEKARRSREFKIKHSLEQLKEIEASRQVFNGIEYFKSTLHGMVHTSNDRWHQSNTVISPFDEGGFNFSKLYEEEHPQHLVASAVLNGNEWHIGMNNIPMFKYHMLVVPKIPRAQVATRQDMSDMQELLRQVNDNKATIVQNCLLAGADVNSLHYHLHFRDFPIFENGFRVYPGTNKFMTRSFNGQGCAEEAAGYLETLQAANQPYNIIMRYGHIIIVPRPDDHVFRFGVTDLAGSVFYGKDRTLEMAREIERSGIGREAGNDEHNIIEAAAKLNNNRDRAVAAANAMNDILYRRPEDAEAGHPGLIDSGEITLSIKTKIAGILSRAKSAEINNQPKNFVKILSLLENSASSLDADSIVASLIARGIKAAAQHQRSIVGIETDLIPGIDQETGYGTQHDAINPLLRTIITLKERLSPYGIDVIIANGNELKTQVMEHARRTGTIPANIIVFGSRSTIDTQFGEFLDAAIPADERPFLAAVDPAGIEQFLRDRSDSSLLPKINLLEMICLTLEIAAGKEPPQTPWIKYDKEKRLLIFLPKPEPMKYDDLRRSHENDAEALRAA